MINKLKDETDVTQVSHAVRFTIAFTCSFAILPQGFVHDQMWAYSMCKDIYKLQHKYLSTSS